MTRPDLDALEKLADEAIASGGGWECSTEAGSAFIEATDPATIKALIAELKEARGLLEVVDEIEARSKSCASLVSENRDNETNARLQGKSQAYDHSAELVRAFLVRNGKGEG